MFNIAYKSTNVKSCTYKYLSARVDRPMLCDDMVFRDEYFAVPVSYTHLTLPTTERV